MERRIKYYRLHNNSQVAEPSLVQFFQKQGITNIMVQNDITRIPANQVLESLKIYIERFEKPFNYMTFDEEAEMVHR